MPAEFSSQIMERVHLEERERVDTTVHTAGGMNSQMRMALLLLCIPLVVTACSKSVPAPAQAKAVVPAAHSAAAAPAAAEEEPPAASSVTVVVFDPPGTGRDPFFPDSSRVPVRSALTDETVVVVRPVLPMSAYLRLTGLWFHPRNSLAYINKTDFRPGERGKVTVIFTNAQNKLESRQVLVHCLEIRRESVLISVEGEAGQKELRLPAMP